MSPFFRFSHFARGSAFTRKVKGFVVYFFAALIKHEIRIKCEKCIECFVFHGMFHENIRKIQQVYSRPNRYIVYAK